MRLHTIEERTLGETPSGQLVATEPQIPPRPPWRSPADQPAWARPALLAIAAVVGVAYVWGSNNAFLEPFYGAAARSMAGSWHDFVFGAFDPAGTVTVDKLPGALWLQALSLRVLGFHMWAVVLPQALEGVLTILVLYRAVRRLAGPVAGVAAATTLAVSPVTVALSRGNVSDSLLILLTVLAADATSAALRSGRLRTLLLVGAWVGLAFQAKMLQAWLVLPAFAVAYLVAAPPRLRVRVGQVALMVVVTVAVSLSWMSAVSLVPAHDRPYVDGSRNDSLFAQVFDYNGFARLGAAGGGVGQMAPFIARQARSGRALNSDTLSISPSWHRLLGGPFGRNDAWLLPAVLVAAACVLRERLGTGRRDPRRAAVLLWGTWLVVLGVAFSGGRYLNSYYVAALSPATAALCGLGADVFWRHRTTAAARGTLAGTLLACTGYGIYLLHGASAVPAWLIPTALATGLAGAAATLYASRAREPRQARWLVAASVACGLLLPAASSLLVVTRNLGPFSTPYERVATVIGTIPIGRLAADTQARLERIASSTPAPITLATDTSTLAANYVFYTGREILPIGGYLGGVPSPTLGMLQRDVAAGRLRAILIPIEPASQDPRIVWVREHCAETQRWPQRDGVQFAVYSCSTKTGRQAIGGNS